MPRTPVIAKTPAKRRRAGLLGRHESTPVPFISQADVAAVLISVLACWILNVATASRLSGVTATLIMLVPRTGSPQSEMVARVPEVGWGVSAAIVVVWRTGWLGLAGGGERTVSAKGNAPTR
jgi:hypothetical protein